MVGHVQCRQSHLCQRHRWQENWVGRLVPRPHRLAIPDQTRYNALKSAGYSPILVDSCLLSGQVRYAGFFKKLSGAPTFAAYHGVSTATHQAKFNSWTTIGYLPVSSSVVSVGGQRQYTAIYKKKSQGSILVCSQLTTAAYQQAYNDNISAGRRVAYLNGYNHAGKAYIIAIFNSCHAQRRTLSPWHEQQQVSDRVQQRQSCRKVDQHCDGL